MGILILLIIGFLITLFASAFLAFIFMPIGILECNAKAGSLEHKYSYIAGCLVSPDGGKSYIPLDNYRAIGD